QAELSTQEQVAGEVAQRASEPPEAAQKLRYGTSTGIEVKRAGEALQASEHSARLIVDSIPGLLVQMTAAGEVDTVNRRVLEYFGKSLEELRNWATSGIIHP